MKLLLRLFESKVKIMRKVLFLLILLIPISISAQTKLEKSNPEKLIERAIQAHQNNDSLEAIRLLDLVNENDSLYLEAIFTKANLYFELEKYNELLELCDTKSFFNEHDYSMQVFKGVAFIRLDENEKAIKHFKNMLKLYPKSYLVYYNLGIAYKNIKLHNEAISSFKEAIILNPYYASPHLELAKICYQEDLISQTILCYDTYLLLNPTGESSLRVLSAFDELVSSKNEFESLNIEVSKDDNAFDEIDLLIKNYTALNKDYKTPNKFNIPLVKQNHALFELLNEFEGNGGFWDKKYVKFYKQLFNSGYFNDFIYYIMSSATNEKYQKIINKNNKNEKKFMAWAADNWLSVVSEENEKEFNYSYLNSGEIESIGGVDKDGEYIGERTYYEKNGRLRTQGFYKEGERDGHWDWYYDNGQKEEEVDYALGELNGSYIKYYDNGKNKLKANYLNNYYNGELYKYSKYGIITEKSEYINDSLNGTTLLFHDLGQDFKKLVIPYEDNVVNGVAKEFYANGIEKMNIPFEKGNRIGEEISYYKSGKISKKYIYVEGELNGPHTEFYNDGSIYITGDFKDGYRSGEWKAYYNTGELSTITNYSEGTLSGIYEEYNRNGKKTMQYIYDEGDIVEYKFFNKDGNILKSSEIEKGIISLEGFYFNGNKMLNGDYVKGYRNGNWEFYNIYGCLLSREEYENKEIISSKDFYVNSSLKNNTTYKNGLRSGYFKTLFIDGTVANEGYYEHDMAEGVWNFYYPDGKLSDKMFYINDNLNGYQYDYSINGKIYTRDFYENGKMISTEYYDTVGIKINTINYFKDTSGYILFPNGKNRIKYSYLNGKAHGKFIWYHINGVISSEGSYFNNEENGYWLWNNDKGVKVSEGNYYHGDKIGIWYEYTDEGKIKSKKNYENGYLHGDYLTFNEDGSNLFKAEYSYGEINGSAYYYGEKGDLQLVRYYDYGELIGYSYLNELNELVPIIDIKEGTVAIKTYFSNGKLARELNFLNGEFDRFYKKYYNNGNLASIDEYIAGIRVGESIQYFENGNIKQKRNYVNGSLHGTHVEYYKDGQLKEELNFLNDELSGMCFYYDPDGSLIKKILYYNGRVYNAEYY